jgi:hypothetical protein
VACGPKLFRYDVDIRDRTALEKVFQEHKGKISCVIHCAGLKAVGESGEDAEILIHTPPSNFPSFSFSFSSSFSSSSFSSSTIHVSTSRLLAARLFHLTPIRARSERATCLL